MGWATREAVIKRLQLADPAAVAVLARRSREPLTRMAAIERLEEQVLIEHRVLLAKLLEVATEVARTDSDACVRWSAVQKLTDQTVLAGIATTDDNWYVRAAATEKLRDRNVLATLSATDKDAFVRLTAEKTLAELWKRDS